MRGAPLKRVYEVSTYHSLGFKLGVVIFGLAALVGCQKKRCQPPAEQALQTFIGTQWRLVQTTDPNPNYRALSNTNFFIMTFNRNFTGDFKRVENNDLYETPVATFIYNVDAANKHIAAEITENTALANNGKATGTTQTNPSPPARVDYNYTLTRELTLTATPSGFHYRFVPFTGVVDPDNQCVF